MIKLQNFSKFYNSKKKLFKAVQNVTFTAHAGRVTGLLGLNGAGKSTILKAICALHYPTQGDVFVCADNDEEKLINTKDDSVFVKQLIGYVPEQPLLYDNFTVYEFIKYVAQVRGVKSFEETLTMCDIDDGFILDKKIRTLSKGYKQRVLFAQALIHNPKILLLDEPSSGLDPAQIYQMKSLITKLSVDKTILLSTHNIDQAQELCSDICILKNGVLVTTGTVENIIQESNEKNLENAFLKITGLKQKNE